MAEKPAHEILHDYLVAASVGSCCCGVKSPDVQWHTPNCPYTILAQALDHADAVRDEIKELLEQIATLQPVT